MDIVALIVAVAAVVISVANFLAIRAKNGIRIHPSDVSEEEFLVTYSDAAAAAWYLERRYNEEMPEVRTKIAILEDQIGVLEDYEKQLSEAIVLMRAKIARMGPEE